MHKNVVRFNAQEEIEKNGMRIYAKVRTQAINKNKLPKKEIIKSLHINYNEYFRYN